MSVNHHGAMPNISDFSERQRLDDSLGEIIKRFEDQQKGSAVPAFPDGVLNEHDEGQIAFKVGVNIEERKVVIDFGKPVSWLAMSPEECSGIVSALIAKMKALGQPFVLQFGAES